ncbi:MAG TPA: hypothetical protein VK574_04335 [Terracidiphilus sp.]|nr:hypothetical protein [Terracidiphilus sp.]
MNIVSFAQSQTGGSSTPEWAWMGGNNTVPAGKGQPGVYGTKYQFAPSNAPGGRNWGALSWTDQSGRLWLFGGSGYDASGTAGYLGDMWVFDPTQGADGEWAWMGGSSTLSTNSVGYTGQPGVYGTEYQFTASNSPGGRYVAINWTDASGRFWLFGGDGFDGAGNAGYLSDLWVFDPSQGTYGEWAWMGGSNTVPSAQFACGQPTPYGTEYQFADSNYPGHRDGSLTWTDQSSRLWLFGGGGCDSAGDPAEQTMNDLWVFDPSQGAHGEWAWMGGNKVGYANGAYGTEYQFAASNAPGARASATGWTDTSGRLWLFGGYGFDSAGTAGELNDLWVFDPTQGANGEWAWVGGSEVARAVGVYGTEYQFAESNVPGSRYEAMSWTDKNGKLWLFGGLGYDSLGHYGYLNDLWVFDPSQGGNGEWLWMGGSNTFMLGYGRSGIYGTEYEFLSSSVPGGRNTGATWVDPDGKLWLFGGEGYDSLGNNGLLNDLWELEVPSSVAPAAMASPAPGSTLTGSRTTFTWTTGSGVTAYYLFVGTTPGGYDLVNIGPKAATSATVSLPTNGATIYVRLWSVINGGLQYHDYTYTEFAGTPAAMTSPAPGSTLTGSSTTFTWTTGSGVTAYYLFVGTTPGGYDLVNIGPKAATSATVSLPTNGATIYVRLYSVINGGLQYHDYTYTEFAGTPAAMTSPTPGSTLTGASTTFTWTFGSGATAYYLFVGTTPGGYDLVNIGPKGATSATVSLPINGATIYVRLWSVINGGLQYHDYTYTEFASTPASMSSPAPGSTLTGASTTFIWTAGSGATAYYLFVGTTPGGYDLVNIGPKAATSATVSLPTNGATIYVRLYSVINGGLQYHDYTYTEAH